MRITRKFTLAVVAGILVVHAGAAVYRADREHRLFERTVNRDAAILGRTLGHAVEQTWTTHGRDAALDVVEHATEREVFILRWVQLDDPADSEHAPSVPVEGLQPLREGETVVRTAEHDGNETLFTYVPVPTPALAHGAIEVAHPLVEERRYLRRSLTNVSIVTSVLVALCALLTWLLGHRLIGAPIRLLVDQARAIGRGELGRRLHLPVRDELGELGAEIDQMCDQLQDAQARLEDETRSKIDAVQQLRHADRLKTVGTLASGVAHELGTPLNVIEGHAALIREESDASPEVLESTEVIARQCKRMTGIIRQLMDFARRGSPRSTSTNAVDVARQTLEMIKPMARKQEVELSLEGADAATVSMGFEELQQVLANLAINALHASRSGGTIQLRIGPQRAKHPVTDLEHDVILISVRDTGVGMEPDVVERVFEPFFTTKDVGDGTGLGLAVAFGIVDDRGGWISVDSAPNRGSTFDLYLPAEVTDA